MLLTANDLAKEWSMAAVTIRKMAADGRLPGAYKMGRDWRFDPIKVKRWFETREQKPQVQSWQSTNAVNPIGYALTGTGKKSGDQLRQLLKLTR